MRIFFAAIVVILVANLGLSLMNSQMTEMMKERNETIQKRLDQL